MPNLSSIDHVHVFTPDRAVAEAWYRRVLQLKSVPELAHWVADGGPLFLSNQSRSVSLALFESMRNEPNRSTIAFQVAGGEFLAWRAHLNRELGTELEAVDHKLSWSLYFADPDGNSFEITTYDYRPVCASSEAR